MVEAVSPPESSTRFKCSDGCLCVVQSAADTQRREMSPVQNDMRRDAFSEHRSWRMQSPDRMWVCDLEAEGRNGGRRKKERDRECVRICVFTLEG